MDRKFRAVRLIILVAAAVNMVAADTQIPAAWGTCQRSDPNFADCLKGAIQRAIASLRTGNAELNMQALDPFVVDQFRLNRGGNGALNIDMRFNNVEIDNVYTSQVDSVRVDQLDGGDIRVELSAPTLTLRGSYVVRGRVLLIPITGDGQANIRMDNVHASFVMRGHAEKGGSGTATGRDHYKVDSFQFDIVPEKASFKFTNPAHAAQTELLSRVVTENDRSIWQELRPTISEAFSSRFKELADAVFDKVALDDVFPA